MKKLILVTGGDGRFANILKKNNKFLNLYFASKKECNILDIKSINKLIITRVDCDIDGDIYYPELDLKKWNLVKAESYKKDSENDYDFKIEEYVRL